MTQDLCFLSATELREHYRRGELSPVEVVEAVLARIENLDGTLRAFSAVRADAVRRAARDAEARLRRSDDVPPLTGIPIGIKDVILTRDLPTSLGSPLLRDFQSEEDEIAVERLRAAGAILLGKTNVPELGFGPPTKNGLVGDTRNPWDTTRTPSGSSGGAAVAVAAGMGPIGLGTDAGGSIRVPASFCGVVGLKPTFGLIPMFPGARDSRYPMIGGFESTEVVGPITRTVADAALVLDVAAGADPRDRHSLPRLPEPFLDGGEPDLRGLRVAWSVDLGDAAAVDPAVRAALDVAVESLADTGADVEEDSPHFDDVRTTFEPIAALELGPFRKFAAERPEALNDRVRDIVSREWSFERVSDALDRRKELANRTWRFFAQYDLLITPTAPVPPYAIDLDFPSHIDSRAVDGTYPSAWFTAPWNLTGNPAISVPVGWTDDGLPIGLQIVGARLADRLVLRAAKAIESSLPWAGRRPKLEPRA